MRVSTSDRSAKQDYERQKYLIEHCDLEVDDVFEEHISGGVKADQRQEFNKMLEKLSEKDLVLFTETSRFGRNYIDCFEMLDLITQQKKASVKFLSNGITLDGGEKMNPYEWMTISQFFIQDEFLKRQISYNTTNALKRKKEMGVVLGRPKGLKDKQVEQIRNLGNIGVKREKIAEMVGTSVMTVSRVLRGNY